MDLPKNVQIDLIVSVVDILSTKLTGSSHHELKAINNNINEKVIDAAIYVGLIKEQNGKYLITENGKNYIQATDERVKKETLFELIKKLDIYSLTLEYFHHNKLEKPTKLDVGSYWNEHFSDQILDLNEESLTSSIIFFFRFCEMASLGKFIMAGRGRETRIDMDMVELAKFITFSPIQFELKSQPKTEKKIPQQDTQKSEVVDENVANSLSILKKLNPELIWSDLDSDGAKKLIIDKLNILSNQNIVYSARVEEYQKLEGENAVLKEKVKNLKADNLFRASVNSIGGVFLGVALTMDNLIYRIIGSLLGAILIAISVFLKETEPKKKVE